MSGKNILKVSLVVALGAMPLQAQELSEPPPEAVSQLGRGLQGEVIGYLAVPALLILTLVAGLLVGSEDEDMPASP